MRRLKDYLKVIAWQAGLGYLLIWAITFWTLDDGARVFGASGVCLPDQAKVLFYWACEAKSPLSILASLANAALTLTVWAPVYVAAATVKPDAMAIAVTDPGRARDRIAARNIRPHPHAGDGARPAAPDTEPQPAPATSCRSPRPCAGRPGRACGRCPASLGLPPFFRWPRPPRRPRARSRPSRRVPAPTASHSAGGSTAQRVRTAQPQVGRAPSGPSK